MKSVSAILIILAMTSSAFALESHAQAVCVHQLRDMGAPVPPNASDHIQVIVTAIQPGARVRVEVEYTYRGSSVFVARIATANAAGAYVQIDVPESRDVRDLRHRVIEQ